ncbi:hypothetical protein ACN28S_29970 [Cystobacter fuscus]
MTPQVVLQGGGEFWLKVEGEHALDEEAGASRPVGSSRQREAGEEEQAKGSARYASPRPFREWTPEQGQLLPQYAREVLGEGHLACFFVELRKALDFSPILKAYTQERGSRPTTR